MKIIKPLFNLIKPNLAQIARFNEKGARIGFRYGAQVLDKNGNPTGPMIFKDNLVPEVARNLILELLVKSASGYATWYLGLTENDYDPLDADTMADYPTNAGENTDYDDSTRQAVTFGTVDDGAVDNSGDLNIVDFTSTGASIRGAFLSSNATREGLTGILMSAVKFGSVQAIPAGGALRVPISLTITSS